MKIIGTHTIIYSKDAEADRKFFRDVLKYRNQPKQALAIKRS